MKSVVYVAFAVHPDMKSHTSAGGGIFCFDMKREYFVLYVGYSIHTLPHRDKVTDHVAVTIVTYVAEAAEYLYCTMTEFSTRYEHPPTYIHSTYYYSRQFTIVVYASHHDSSYIHEKRKTQEKSKRRSQEEPPKNTKRQQHKSNESIKRISNLLPPTNYTYLYYSLSPLFVW